MAFCAAVLGAACVSAGCSRSSGAADESRLDGSSSSRTTGRGGGGGGEIQTIDAASTGLGEGGIVSCLSSCGPTEICLNGQCVDGCTAADVSRASVGCEYYATFMDIATGINKCFAVIVANAWGASAHIEADFEGVPVDLAAFARIPRGAGRSLSYVAFDPVAGLAPADVAVLFLADSPSPTDTTGLFRCPAPAARGAEAFFTGTGRGHAFHIRSSVPVVAYQMLPFGGGRAAVAGASLLIPTSAWDVNYIAVDAYSAWSDTGGSAFPSLNLVAKEDATTVTVLPNVAIAGGTGVDPALAHTPVRYALGKGEMLQISQPDELTGSPVEADKPIGLWAGHQGMRVPTNAPYADHAEQQIPPIRALGYRYAAASYRPRTEAPERPPYRIVGVVDGARLTFDPPVPGAPASINLGEVAEFVAPDPFVVDSQDADHPFLLVTYMTGASTVGRGGDVFGAGDYGDPDFVRIPPSAQYLDQYVFFTDPTYPETDLVVIRSRSAFGFADVALDCAGALSGWQPVGTRGEYEFTRIDLVRHAWAPQGNCDNGRHQISSAAPFGLFVWGWGSWETDVVRDMYSNTRAVSYGYPAGENIAPINRVVVPANIR
jgi:hypothetical protein